MRKAPIMPQLFDRGFQLDKCTFAAEAQENEALFGKNFIFANHGVSARKAQMMDGAIAQLSCQATRASRATFFPG